MSSSAAEGPPASNPPINEFNLSSLSLLSFASFRKERGKRREAKREKEERIVFYLFIERVV